MKLATDGLEMKRCSATHPGRGILAKLDAIALSVKEDHVWMIDAVGARCTHDSVTASTDLLDRRPAVLNAFRTLTGSEIELLRKSRQDVAAYYKARQTEAVAP
jgi:hypothetical protein